MASNGNNTIQTAVLEDIIAERNRQNIKHPQGKNQSPYRWLVILNEETGEVAKALLEGDLLNYYEEMIQVAAVAVAALEDLSHQIATKGN